MSHIHSPGPTPLPHPQMPAQSASVTSANRQKSKPYATGIAAGVEDEKYQAKYKELKRKVREIETDNDKLHYKVLMAKKSIQRMKLERAVLYERLSAVPPSPDLHSHALPPAHSGPGVPPQHPRDIGATAHHQLRDPRDFQPVDLNDHNAIEYMHNHSSYRVIPGPDGRPIQAPDGPIGPGVPPSHAISAVHMSRGSGHDSRQLPPLSQLTPIQHLEPPRAHGHSQAHSPHIHPHSNGSSRSRSSPSRSRGHQIYSQAPPPGYHSGGIPHPQQQYPPESLIPVQHGHHSPPHPSDRERSRRHETFDRGGHHGDPYAQSRHHSSPHSSSMVSPTSARASSRLHNHQRAGPGVNVNHPDPEYERERELERERAWARHEAERESAREYAPSVPMHASPPLHLRPRPPVDRADYPYSREPIGPGMHGRSSRSDTSGSGSGSGSGNGGGDSLLRQEGHTQYYDRERGPYAPRQPNPPRGLSEDQDVIHDDGRPYSRDRSGGHYPPPEQHRPPVESSRKRSRKDMEIEGDDDVDDSPAAGASRGGGDLPSRFTGSNLADDRGTKRIHQEIAARSHEREQDDDGASDT
ncbi:hypothetical protein K503DRAFT_730300 [Rhizopogon vinicolor AM-OR11-026]|uniref:INO80 complex subunit F domain-containing protein n=1 Tax=Rhizopogon vinicolor AM-OR11-026 TaxID=1314800 RepID=A0A1B7NGP5_9AGAM|nr:hypothetical protein K503DRAFT_730300 [Rhizopogon vinicolor AM-OR11-026]